MATYVPGSEQYLPDIKPFTPDYKFLSAVLDVRQDKYNANWKSTNDVYNKVVYSNLSRQDTSEQRDQYIKNLGPSLEKIAGMDLSLAQNAQSAKAVFAPFFEDKVIVRDMVYTAAYMDQLKTAEQYKNSPVEDVREKWNAIGLQKMQFELKDFQNASRDEVFSFANPKYVQDADLFQNSQKYLKKLGLTATVDTFPTSPGEDGTYGQYEGDPAGEDDFVNEKFIIKDTDGKLIEGEAYNQVMRAMYDDPIVQDFYNAKAFVESRVYAEDALAAGGVGSIQEGVSQWASRTTALVQKFNKEREANVVGEIKDQTKVRVTWEGIKQTEGLLPSDETIISENLNNLDQLRIDLERVESQNQILNTISDANAENGFDQANISRAYGLLANNYMTADMFAGAKSYSLLNKSSEIRENKFELDEQKQLYEIAQIKMKADNTLKLEIFKQEKLDERFEVETALKLKDQELKELEILNKSGGSMFQNTLLRGREISGDPMSSVFNIDVDNNIKKGEFQKQNTLAIAKANKKIKEDERNLIPEMLAIRYDNNNGKYTITLTDEKGVEEEVTGTQMELRDKLKRPKLEIIDGVEENLGYYYQNDIDRIFNQQSEWFKDENAVYKEKGANYTAAGGGYNETRKKLFFSDPTDPSKMGLIQRKKLIDQMIISNGNVFYDQASSTAAGLTAKNKNGKPVNLTFSELVDKGYPMPYVIRNGVKVFETKEEFTKRLRSLIVPNIKRNPETGIVEYDGDIENFDPSGTNDASNGDDNPNWMNMQFVSAPSIGPATVSMLPLIDYESIDGKAAYIWDQIYSGIESQQSVRAGKTFLNLQRGITRGSGTDMAFVSTRNAIASGNPKFGSAADQLLRSMTESINSLSADPSNIVLFTAFPEDVEALSKIDVTTGDYSASAKAANFIWDQIAQSEGDKVKFNISYYPNLGAQVIDENDKAMSPAKAGYKIDQFSPEFAKKLNALEESDLPAGVTTDGIKNILSSGLGFMFPRDLDTNPGNFRDSGSQSTIMQMINLSSNGMYTYTPEVNATTFSPGKQEFRRMNNGSLQQRSFVNTYDPNATNPEKMYTTVDKGWKKIINSGQGNFAIDLNKQLDLTRMLLSAQDKKNASVIYQVRSRNLSETKWKEGWIKQNKQANVTSEQMNEAADIAYKEATKLFPKEESN